MDLSDITTNGATSRSSRRAARPTSNTPTTPPSYGYHNTFRTHEAAVLSSPPSYACANSSQTLNWLNTKALAEAAAVRNTQAPPAYTCTIQFEGIMGMKQELVSVFELARTREWNDVYVVLRGTQLTIHRLKSPSMLSKSRTPTAGKVIRSFTMQHAEVGVAADFKKTSLVPKSPFAHLVPASARQKLYETDPHLFEPVREHVLRLRLETEQFLLCATGQEEMLDRVEQLCAAIDISPPLEDRSEPRYRSLPRRSRRQRVIDGSRLGENLEHLSSLDVGRRIIAEQEAIIRQLYPQLATTAAQEASVNTYGADPDREEFDPDDVRFPSRRPESLSVSRTNSRDGEASAGDTESLASNNSKTTPIARASRSQVLRYRKRCAPALLACSPRVSDVVFSNGRRLRINTKEQILVGYTSHPPRYESHSFPKPKRSPRSPTELANRTSTKSIPAPISIERPASPLRGISDDSVASFGYDLGSTSSDQGSDEIQSAAPSEPPSPTSLTQAKADAAHHLASMDKRQNSEEPRLSAVTLGVGLLI
jgi:hypothetical protein